MNTYNAISLNTFQHVVAVYNSSDNTVNFYVNGVSAGSGSFNSSPLSNSNALSIGNRFANDRQFDGIIDDVRIYNSALSQTEIQNIYTGLW